MKKELLFLLTIVFWIYRISTDSEFSVQTTCTPPHNWRDEIQINCAVCGFSDNDFLHFEVEWHLQKNLSITSPAKSTPGNPEGNNTKYWWEFITLTSDGDYEGNKTVFKLVDKNPTSLSLGIYTCYVTLNKNMTKHSSVDLSSGEEDTSSNYILINVTNVPVGEITENCRKYGYNVLMNESVAKSVRLREKESVYFPVCPSIQINNKSIAVCKPWISRIGCYNITVDMIANSTEMDCRNINITNWNKSLPLIGNTTHGSCYLLDGKLKDVNPKVSDAYCTEAGSDNSYHDKTTMFLTLFSIVDNPIQLTEETKSECVATHKDFATSELYEKACDERCDAFCTQYNEPSVSSQGFLDWEDALEICRSQNSSLPNENFQFSDPTQFSNGSAVCLYVFKSSSVLFEPVIKLARNKNGTIIINTPTNYSEKLPFLCGMKIDD
ncbi:uncharacterized protein LOC133181200 [Saccostrea echinata]|uniref:uncharacterized protein LOC133181200 n=1 Tax=Saccostrea echinata TaxID=191078 RepID=UPI002A8315B0|nr:uncharacterized protein LOC133181200 [Saccostrea echinata]